MMLRLRIHQPASSSGPKEVVLWRFTRFHDLAWVVASTCSLLFYDIVGFRLCTDGWSACLRDELVPLLLARPNPGEADLMLVTLDLSRSGPSLHQPTIASSLNSTKKLCKLTAGAPAMGYAGSIYCFDLFSSCSGSDAVRP